MIRQKRIRQCEDAAIEWLVRLSAPDLTEQQREAFFAWLNESPLHQAAYIKAESLWERGAALQHLEGSKPAARQRMRVHSQWSWALAGACVLLICILFFLRAPEPEYYQAQTEVGEQRELLLSDDSMLVLNTDSQVLVELQSKSRVAYLLRGEVFFHISSDPARPFDVITNEGTVRVLGTRFSVRATGSDTIITVLEGKVGLSQNPQGEEFHSNVTLTANQQLNLRGALPGAAPQEIDASAALSWRTRQLVFRGESLQAVVQDLNRYFPLPITLADHTLGDLEVSAVIQLKTAETTVQALADALGLEVLTDPADRHLILRKPE
jgi:transmembrane sensor